MRKYLIRLQILLLVFLTACARKNDNASAVEVSFQQQECQTFIRSLSSNYEYGWITVPENYENPSIGPLIKVFYWFEKKKSPQRHVLFFNGGPGYHSHDANKSFKRNLAKHELNDSEASLIFMDQRGTGCSSPYPDPINDTEKLRARFYGSTGIVSDSEALRKKLLGDKKWVIFGQSYGGFIVHRYVAHYPQSLELDVAHGNAITSDPLTRLKIRLFANYSAFEQFFTNHSDYRSYFEMLIKKFANKNKCVKTIYKDEFCGFESINWMIEAVSSSGHWSYLAEFFRASTESSEPFDTKAFLKWFDDYTDEPVLASPRSSWASKVIMYVDRNVAPMTMPNCLKAYSILYKERGLDLSDLTEKSKTFTECSAPIQHEVMGRTHTHVRTLFDGQRDILTMTSFKSGLESLGKNRFFLYSSSKDGFLPPEMFEEEVAKLGHLLTYKNFENSGHDGYLKEPEILKKVFGPRP